MASTWIQVYRASDNALVYDNNHSGSTAGGSGAGSPVTIASGLVDEVQYYCRVAALHDAVPQFTQYWDWTLYGLSGGGENTLTPSISYSVTQTPSGLSFPTETPASWSPWSPSYYFTPSLVVAPVATQTLPAVAAQVPTLTPSLVFSYSASKPAATFTAYQVEVRRVSDSVMFWQPGQLAATTPEKAANQVTKVYAGTALVNNTAYQWCVRVQSSQAQWSPYTGWRNFTPVITPAMPTNIVPSGQADTLTPHIGGTYNIGSGAAEQQYQYLIQYPGGVAVYDSGAVTGTLAVGQNYGTNNAADNPAAPPALTWATAYQISVRSKDTAGSWSAYSAWQDFWTNSAPTAPSNVQPNGSTTPNTTPTITWTHNDPDGDAQTTVDIELYDQTAAAYVAGYGPKTLAQSALAHVVTTALTLTHVYQVRVRTVGLAGAGYSPWSNPVTFTVATVPAVAITAPTVAQVLAQSALNVTWTFAGGSGVQQDYRVLVYGSDSATIVYDSTVLAGASTVVAIPAGYFVNGQSYFVQAIVRDTLAQSASTVKVPVSTVWPPPEAVGGLAARPFGSQL